MAATATWLASCDGSVPMWFDPGKAILFVPADKPELVHKAVNQPVSAVCLDLEDGVADVSKDMARRNLQKAAPLIAKAGKALIVRVNGELEVIGADLAALPQECAAVVLPKTESLHQASLVASALDRMAMKGGPDAALICLIETAAGVGTFSKTAEQAAPPRLRALFFGAEDLSADLSCLPDGDLITSCFHSLAIGAKSKGLSLLGFPGSIGEFARLDQFRQRVRLGADAGASGAFCIHPNQVPVLNDVFRPSAEQIAKARAIIAAFDDGQANGQGAVAVDGAMIDRPIYLRALATVARAE